MPVPPPPERPEDATDSPIDPGFAEPPPLLVCHVQGTPGYSKALQGTPGVSRVLQVMPCKPTAKSMPLAEEGNADAGERRGDHAVMQR
jgi:hypothetical protein